MGRIIRVKEEFYVFILTILPIHVKKAFGFTVAIHVGFKIYLRPGR